MVFYKTLRFLLLSSMLTGGIFHLSGQTPLPNHHLRIDLTAFLQKGVGFNYEYRTKKGNGFELGLYYQKFKELSSDIFNGDRIVTYAEERTDSIIGWSGKALNSGQWRYIGSNRPFPYLPEWLAYRTGFARVGYMHYLPYASTHWRFFLRPGLFGGLYEYYAVNDETRVIDNTYSVTPLTNIQGAQRWDRKVFYEQTRSMRYQKHFFYGLSYDAGISRMLGRHFFLEARGALSLNLNPPPEPHPPVPVRRLSAQGMVMLGYQFGGIKPQYSQSAPAPQ